MPWKISEAPNNEVGDGTDVKAPLCQYQSSRAEGLKKRLLGLKNWLSGTAKTYLRCGRRPSFCAAVGRLRLTGSGTPSRSRWSGGVGIVPPL